MLSGGMGPARLGTAAGLAFLIALGAYVRGRDLDVRSLTHLEMYVPGIPLPDGLSIPPPRSGLAAAIKGTLSETTWPPLYYALMSWWTALAGPSVIALRLPSLLAGLACIPLAFALCAMTVGRRVAWIAAILISTNPFLAFFDQFARATSLATALGLMATVLLVVLARTRNTTAITGGLYVAALVAGAATHVFFWTIISAHIVWTLVETKRNRLPFPDAARAQAVAVVLASPLLAFAAYQSRNPSADLSADLLVYARELVSFGFIFPLFGFSTGMFPADLSIHEQSDPALSMWRWLFVAFSVALFVIGLAAAARHPHRTTDSTSTLATTRPWFRRALIGSALLATLVIIGFIAAAYQLARETPNPEILMTEAMTVLPAGLAGLAAWLERRWQPRANVQHADSAGIGSRTLLPTLAVVPFAILATTSLFVPVLNARNMTMLVPFVLTVLAAGIARSAKSRSIGVVVTLLLVSVHVSALSAYRSATIERADYRRFAEQLTSKLGEDDLLLFSPSWYATPFLYYCSPAWDRLVSSSDAAATLTEHPRARVWVLLFDDESPREEFTQALHGYRLAETIEQTGARALLYIASDVR